jgi:hypothetical protein
LDASGVEEPVEVGGLMSYGTDVLEMYRQVGAFMALLNLAFVPEVSL